MDGFADALDVGIEPCLHRRAERNVAVGSGGTRAMGACRCQKDRRSATTAATSDSDTAISGQGSATTRWPVFSTELDSPPATFFRSVQYCNTTPAWCSPVMAQVRDHSVRIPGVSVVTARPALVAALRSSSSGMEASI